MLDIRRIRSNPQELIDALQKRNSTVDLTEFLQKEEQRRQLLNETESLKARRNEESKRIAQIKREGGDAQPIMDEMRAVGDQINAIDAQVKEIEEYINQFLLRLPNYPNATVPIGKDDTENVEQRRWGTPRQFEWEPKAHWDIGTDLKILDWDAAGKISGARFTVYRGLGARLERSVINFFMDTHAENGYTEVLPPYMVNRETMTGTGQLPKFEEDAYKVFTGKQGESAAALFCLSTIIIKCDSACFLKFPCPRPIIRAEQMPRSTESKGVGKDSKAKPTILYPLRRMETHVSLFKELP